MDNKVYFSDIFIPIYKKDNSCVNSEKSRVFILAAIFHQIPQM